MDVIKELKFLGKFTKKNWGGGWVCSVWGVIRVDLIEELKFLGKIIKKIYFFFWGGGGGVGDLGRGGGGGGVGLVWGSEWM